MTEKQDHLRQIPGKNEKVKDDAREENPSESKIYFSVLNDKRKYSKATCLDFLFVAYHRSNLNKVNEKQTNSCSLYIIIEEDDY